MNALSWMLSHESFAVLHRPSGQITIITKPECFAHFAITPRKINIDPENDGLEDDFPFPGVYSQVPC